MCWTMPMRVAQPRRRVPGWWHRDNYPRGVNRRWYHDGRWPHDDGGPDHDRWWERDPDSDADVDARQGNHQSPGQYCCCKQYFFHTSMRRRHGSVLRVTG